MSIFAVLGFGQAFNWAVLHGMRPRRRHFLLVVDITSSWSRHFSIGELVF